MSGNPRAPTITKGGHKRGALQKARVEVAIFLIERKLRFLLAQYDFPASVAPLQIGVVQFDGISGQFLFKPRRKTIRHGQIDPDPRAPDILKIAFSRQSIGTIDARHIILQTPTRP